MYIRSRVGACGGREESRVAFVEEVESKAARDAVTLGSAGRDTVAAQGVKTKVTSTSHGAGVVDEGSAVAERSQGTDGDGIEDGVVLETRDGVGKRHGTVTIRLRGTVIGHATLGDGGAVVSYGDGGTSLSGIAVVDIGLVGYTKSRTSDSRRWGGGNSCEVDDLRLRSSSNESGQGRESSESELHDAGE